MTQEKGCGRGQGRRGAGIAIGLIAVLAASGGGYWLGSQRGHGGDAAPASAAAPAGEAAGKKEKKLLYYRNPMGLPDTSPVPKKDPMGMDYIPVYEGGEDADEVGPAGSVKISTQKVQKLGVKSEPAQLRVLSRTVRAAGRIEPDERRLFAISPKFEIPSSCSRVQFSRSRTVKMPVSSRQLVVRTDSPISAVLISSFSAISSDCIRSLYGIRGMGSLPCDWLR